MKCKLFFLLAIVVCGFEAGSTLAGEDRSEKRREERAIDWDKEKIERVELRAAIEKETLVVSAEHKKALAELRASLLADKDGKFDHVGVLKRLHKEHRELVEHLVRHIHEAREDAHSKDRRDRR